MKTICSDRNKDLCKKSQHCRWSSDKGCQQRKKSKPVKLNKTPKEYPIRVSQLQEARGVLDRITAPRNDTVRRLREQLVHGRVTGAARERLLNELSRAIINAEKECINNKTASACGNGCIWEPGSSGKPARCLGRYEQRFLLGSPEENKERIERLDERYRTLEKTVRIRPLMVDEEEEWAVLQYLRTQLISTNAFLETQARRHDALQQEIEALWAALRSKSGGNSAEHRRHTELQTELKAVEQETATAIQKMSPVLTALVVLGGSAATIGATGYFVGQVVRFMEYVSPVMKYAPGLGILYGSYKLMQNWLGENTGTKRMSGVYDKARAWWRGDNSSSSSRKSTHLISKKPLRQLTLAGYFQKKE